MLRRLALGALAAGALCATSGAAHADGPIAPEIATYALVVGSNTGGPGQAELHYAEDDARRVAQVLTELGGYAADHVEVVVHPTPAELRDRIAELAARVQADAAAGRQTRVFFYYSGHARAQAIDLGAGELPLGELRERLFGVPATLTVVVLDACQSGAFARVKGAAPAADFSYSSRQHLDAAGVAVLASSSGSELSQESEQLRSSYFTHHLLVGLRGAGDANGDGQVTIDEAYRYAYNQTLLATAETAVGGQHVTFEVDLKGHGDVALSFPRAATAAIVLPADLVGKTLVEDTRSSTVVAETYKARGAAVRIAVALGAYDVLVRDGTTLYRCALTAPGEVELARCKREQVAVAVIAKGGELYDEAEVEERAALFAHPYRIELGVSLGGERGDAYTANLSNFGYTEGLFSATWSGQITALRRMSRYVWLGAQVAHATLPVWTHSITGADALQQQLTWNATTIGAVGRGAYPLGRHLEVYGQLMAGVGIGRSDLEDTNDMTYAQTNVGPALAAGAGAVFHFPLRVDALVGYEFDYAPIVKDLIGDTHAVGGNRATFALGYSF